MGKQATTKRIRRAMRGYREAGYDAASALHQAYLFHSGAQFRCSNRQLRRMLPTADRVRVTRVRRDPGPGGTFTAYGEVVCQVGSLMHRAAVPNRRFGLILLDGAVAKLRALEAVQSGAVPEEDQDDIDTETFEPIAEQPVEVSDA